MIKIFSGKYGVNEDGLVYSFVTNKYLKATQDPKGYYRVGLMVDGKLETHKVHRLVAAAFIPNPEDKPQVNHINCIRNDNRVENLEWVTAKENTHHSIKMGTFSFQTPEASVNKTPKKGELNGVSKLKDHQVLDIRASYKPRIVTRQDLADKYGVTISCIKDILSGRSWGHLWSC